MKMNSLSIILAALTCVPLIAQEPDQEITSKFRLDFVGNDHFTGSITGGTWEGLNIASDELVEPVAIEVDRLLSLERIGETKSLPNDHVARIVFNNGDSLAGRLMEVKDDTLMLETAFGGTLEIPRIFVRTLEVEDTGDAVFIGPGARDSWDVSPDRAWTLNGREWVSKTNGRLGRKVEYPDQFVISFEGTWRNRLNFQMQIGEHVPDGKRLTDFYRIQFNNRNVNVQRNSQRAGRHELRPLQVNRQAFANAGEENESHFEIFVDRPNAMIAISMDGLQVGRFQAEADVFSGIVVDHLGFYGDNSNQLRLSDISVRQWDGIMPDQNIGDPEESIITLTEAETEKGYRPMPLANGDTIIGKILEIRDNAVKIETEFTNLSVAIARLSDLPLGTRDDQAIRMRGDVRAYFSNARDSMLFKLISIDGDQATVLSDNFGETTLDLRYFSKIEFWPHSSAMNRLRETAHR